MFSSSLNLLPKFDSLLRKHFLLLVSGTLLSFNPSISRTISSQSPLQMPPFLLHLITQCLWLQEGNSWVILCLLLQGFKKQLPFSSSSVFSAVFSAVALFLITPTQENHCHNQKGKYQTHSKKWGGINTKTYLSDQNVNNLNKYK